MRQVPRLMLAGAVGLLLALAGFLYWTDRPAFRYGFVGGSQDCSVRQMVRMPASADFAAFGSSRVRRGIDQSLIVEASAEQISEPFNLGRPQRNIVRTYRMLQDLYDRGTELDYIFVEVDLDHFRPGTHTQPGVDNYVGVLKYGDILLMNSALKEMQLLPRLHFVGRHLLKKLGDSIAYAASGKFAHNYALLDRPIENVCWKRRFDRSTARDRKRLEEWRVKMARKHGDLKTAVDDGAVDATSAQAVAELFFLRRIRDLAARHGTTMIVSQHWRAYQPPLSPQVVAQLQEIIPDFAYPPADVVRSTWPHFMDTRHMGEKARRAFSLWMVSELQTKELAGAARP